MAKRKRRRHPHARDLPAHSIKRVRPSRPRRQEWKQSTRHKAQGTTHYPSLATRYSPQPSSTTPLSRGSALRSFGRRSFGGRTFRWVPSGLSLVKGASSKSGRRGAPPSIGFGTAHAQLNDLTASRPISQAMTVMCGTDGARHIAVGPAVRPYHASHFGVRRHAQHDAAFPRQRNAGVSGKCPERLAKRKRRRHPLSRALPAHSIGAEFRRTEFRRTEGGRPVLGLSMGKGLSASQGVAGLLPPLECACVAG